MANAIVISSEGDRHVCKDVAQAERFATQILGGFRPTVRRGKASTELGTITVRGCTWDELFGEGQYDVAKPARGPVAAGPLDGEEFLSKAGTSKDGLRYSVFKNKVTGEVRCECSTWGFSAASPKTCKHLDALADDALLPDAYLIPAKPAPARKPRKARKVTGAEMLETIDTNKLRRAARKAARAEMLTLLDEKAFDLAEEAARAETEKGNQVAQSAPAPLVHEDGATGFQPFGTATIQFTVKELFAACRKHGLASIMNQGRLKDPISAALEEIHKFTCEDRHDYPGCAVTLRQDAKVPGTVVRIVVRSVLLTDHVKVAFTQALGDVRAVATLLEPESEIAGTTGTQLVYSIDFNGGAS